MPPHRVAVIGDVAGHLDELRTELRRLGADPDTGRLPDDLTVVQVGDLVHRGPASDAVIALVDGYLTHQPRRWVQLVGNHEAQYLREPAFDWPERISARSRDTLLRWWEERRMLVAAAVLGDDENFLITHAGVTTDFWRGTLPSPRSAVQAAALINSLIGEHADALFRAGAMLHGRRLPGSGARDPDDPRVVGSREIAARAIGPVWAATACELLPGWLGTTLPFSQVHGHDSIFDWRRRCFRANPDTDVADELAHRTVIDEDAKHEITSLAGGRIIGVDPGHGAQARRPWRAWEIRTCTDQAVPGVGGSGME
ncbi:MAG TPA: metallophosphoesterase [Pseudonocardia sp.]|nr:metallophosphoesterase [Pseudonocardia sp.]